MFKEWLSTNFNVKKLALRKITNERGNIMRFWKKCVLPMFAVFLTISLIGADSVSAADSGVSTVAAGDTISLNKTATLEDDGTYTIDLEAWATGSTAVHVEEKAQPLDIVFVIDQSGSMALTNDGENTSDDTQRRLYELKQTLLEFSKKIAENAEKYGVEHRVSIAGFAGSNSNARSSSDITGITHNGSTSYWLNTGLYANGEFIQYGNSRNSEESSLTAQNYKDSWLTVNSGGGEVNDTIEATIDMLVADGGTYVEYGVLMAQNMFEYNELKDDSSRKKVMIFFTDSAPTSGGLLWSKSERGEAIETANTIKNTYDSDIYCVGFSNVEDEVDEDFMQHLSSNYLDSGCEYNSGFLGIGAGWEYSGTQTSEQYALDAGNIEELDGIFTTIMTDVTTTTTSVTLNASAIMKDILADEMILPEGYNPDTEITVKTISGTTTDGANIIWGDETQNNVSVDVEGNEISISNFDYSSKYIAVGHVGEKLEVTIKGVEATDAMITGTALNTNDIKSGVYQDSSSDTPFVIFPQPQTVLTEKLYVLDYAKEAELNASDWKQSSVLKVCSDLSKFSDDTADVEVETLYGAVTKQTVSVTYKPLTTKWNGYDSFYVFGKTSDVDITGMENSANANGNMWSKVTVMPANSVYYEDDFVTEESTGIVGIEYSGTWTTDGSSTGNKETENTSVHGGWENVDLADDTTYTDGSAHKAVASNENVARATFQFTGTGVDVYSRTNDETGTILVTLFKVADDGTKTPLQGKIISNKSFSGDYYQIPTVSFGGSYFDQDTNAWMDESLEYATYEVSITVTTAAAAQGRCTYYLDGIRVYNPMQNKAQDEVVKEAYGDEQNAVFTLMHNLLAVQDTMETTTDTAYAVFIDEVLTKSEEGEIVNRDSVAKNYEETEYGTYGPKNEVYLEKGQSIVFTVDNSDAAYKYCLGIKAPEGTATAEVTNGSNKSELNITGTSDLYYELTPDENGMVVLKNMGDNLLAITKLKATNNGTETAILTTTAEEAVSYSVRFRSLEVVEYVKGPEAVEPDDTTSEEETGDVVVDTSNGNDSILEDTLKVDIEKIDSLFNYVVSMFQFLSEVLNG